MFAGVTNIEIGDKKVANIYLGQNPIPVYTSGTPVDPEQIININFSHTGITEDDASGWNTLRFTRDGETYIQNPTSYNFPNLLDENGNNSGIGFNIDSAVTNPGIGDASITGQTFPIPQVYIKDFWQEGSTTTSMVWRLSGLDIAKKYDLRFLTYVDDSAGALFSIDNGSTWSSPATIFPTTANFDDPAYISFNDVIPNSQGEILINVMSGNVELWFDVFAMRVRKQGSGPAPTPPSTFRAVQKDNNTSPYGFYEFLPENYDNQSSLPLLIFLHGSDERGNGNSELNKVLLWGPPKMANLGTFNENMIMLAPQWLGNDDTGYYAYEDLADFIQYAKDTYKVDEDRIYLNGISAGNWLGMYYLGNLPDSHGIAAMVVTSGTLDLEGGYTPASFVAPSECSMWWISNIDDPAVPWDNTKPPVAQYVPVVTAVSQINAITPGMVEKLTGFDDNTHTDTWDGMYDGSLIGTADPGFDPFDETLYAWMLGHTLQPPVGRIFNVGTGSGNLTINGTDNTKPWYPLQAGDIFEIQGGTYDSITTSNLQIEGSPIIIRNVENETITANFLYIDTQKNVNYLFDSSISNGLTLVMQSQETMHIDRAGAGGLEDVYISGIKFTIESGTPDGGVFVRHSQNATTSYTNGSGTTSIKNLTIENIEFDFTPKANFAPWYLMAFNRGDLSASVDNNFIDGITIRNIRATGQFYTSTAIEIKNCQNALVDDVYFDSLNNNYTDDPPHARIILIQGQGIIQNCYMRNGMGNVGVIWGYNRLANNSPSIIRNCLSFNSFRYSTAEIQGYSNLIVSGVSKAPHYKMLGLVADTLDTGNYFSGCAGDIYPLLGGTFEAKNSVSINGHSNSSGQNNPFNNMAGGTGTISNNEVYANRTLAGVEDETYIPQTGSPLIGAGIADADLTDDYYRNVRPNPPSIGAVEPQ